MFAEHLLSLDTGVGVTGHAHPPPVADPVPSKDAQRQYLEDLIADVAFDIELYGLAFHANAPPHQMQYPRLRKSDFRLQATDIDHLDVVSCWKGISNAQALELTLWERLFQQCLLAQFVNHMRRSIVAQLSKCRYHIQEDELLPYLIQSLLTGNKRLVKIDLPNLVRDMIDAFYDDHPGETAARNFRWSLGSGDLPSFVYNYIATQDCFLRTSEGMYMSVNVSFDWYTMPVLAVVACIAWQPPNFNFTRRAALQLESRGQDVVALYCERPSGGSESSGYKHFPDNVDYVVKLYETKGDTPKVSNTIVQANMITQFPGDVRFERKSRYTVKGEVVDIHQVDATPGKYRPRPEGASTPWVPSYTNTPLSKTRASNFGTRSSLLDSLLQEHAGGIAHAVLDGYSDQDCDTEQDSTTGTPTHEVLLSDPETRTESPKKRKASLRSTSSDGASDLKTTDPEPDTCLKRQKLKASDNSDLPATFTPTDAIDSKKERATRLRETKAELKSMQSPIQFAERPEGPWEQVSIDLVRRLREAIARSRPLAYTVATPNLSDPKDDYCDFLPKAKENKVVLPPSPAMEKHDPFLPPPTPIYLTNESDTSDASAPNSASDASVLDVQNSGHGISGARSRYETELSQDEIQKNYREFEELAKRRKTDPTYAPVSDVGDMNFERIFLGDSEMSDLSFDDADGLSEGMSGLDMEE